MDEIEYDTWKIVLFVIYFDRFSIYFVEANLIRQGIFRENDIIDGWFDLFQKDSDVAWVVTHVLHLFSIEILDFEV